MTKEKLNNFQIDRRLRQDFKATSYNLGYTSMKQCLIDELDRIMNDDESIYKIKTPEKDNLVNFTILLDDNYKQSLKNFVNNTEVKILRDFIATAMINVIKSDNESYDETQFVAYEDVS